MIVKGGKKKHTQKIYNPIKLYLQNNREQITFALELDKGLKFGL